MDEIAQMATDERTARVILALGCEPGDELATRFVAEHGAIGTVHQIAGGTTSDEAVRVRNWREGVIRRLDLSEVSRVLLQTQELGLQTLIPSDPGWPAPAGEAAAQPLVLWMRGDPSVLSGRLPRVAVIGSREATNYGRNVTRFLAAELADRGVVVLTSGSHGIDTHATLGAASGGGHTIAVLPSGLDRPYPSNLSNLFRWIATDGGALVSANPPGQPTNRAHARRRDRLVAAMADAVVVTESGHHSPALKIAHDAVAMGRPIGAVPGEIYNPASAGTNELLRQHVARMVTDATDIMNLLSAPRPATPPAEAAIGSAGRKPLIHGRPRPEGP